VPVPWNRDVLVMGTEVLRVATARIQVTTNREEAEQKANVGVVATHATQRAAAKAKKGDFRAAQLEMRTAQRLMQRANVEEKKVQLWADNVEEMDQVLRNEGKVEERGEAMSDNTTRNIVKFSNVQTEDLFEM